MPSDFEIDVDLTAFSKYLGDVSGELEQAFEKLARDTAAGAAARTTRVDTGIMKDSWKAKQLGFLDWLVGSFGCTYAIFHEFGTTVLSACPMLRPSVQENYAVFQRALNAFLRKLNKKYGD